ncbi:MAG TPA: ABC transporter permease [Pyrinomonadaceae bacterium]|jgi:lipopolysaccharide transport system permease protein|nr:ABC transporter permease [Pyrinomonadaceae bacterium]
MITEVSPANSEAAAERARLPFIRINASASSVLPQLTDAWRHRELLYFLIWRDLTLRYRQTLLGVTWVVLQPILMTAVFTIFFSRLGHFQSDGIPYPLFAYAGLVSWTFFANSVSAGSASLLANTSIITKVYFPRMLVPIATVGVRLVDLLVASIVLIGLMRFYDVPVHASVILVPIFISESALLAVAVGSGLAVLNLRYRDIGTLLPVLIQVWMFASPIIYQTSIVPGRWRLLYSLNPLVGIVDGFRAALCGLPIDWRGVFIASIVMIVLLAYVARIFHRWHERLVEQL